MQDYAFIIKKAEIELFCTHSHVQGFALSLPILSHIVCLDLLKIMQLEISLRRPGEDGTTETVFLVEEEVLSYFYV